jgi:hypothetical protein
MKRILLPALTLLMLFSCKQIESGNLFGKNSSNGKKVEINQGKDSESVQLDFDHPHFEDRAQELMYIREYIHVEVPLIYLKYFAVMAEKSRENYSVAGYYYSKDKAAQLDTSDLCDLILLKAVNNNMSFNSVKRNLQAWILNNRPTEKESFLEVAPQPAEVSEDDDENHSDAVPVEVDSVKDNQPQGVGRVD